MILVFFLGILIAFVLWNFTYYKLWNQKLQAELCFLQPYAYEGEEVKLHEVIENRKRFPIPVLEVGFHLKKELMFHDMENASVSDQVYKRDVYALLGRQRITRTLSVDCTKRGYYEVDSMHFTAHSLLYDRFYTMDQPIKTNLYVYAKRTDVSQFMLVCEKLMGSQQCARYLYEDPFEFAAIREYNITDSMKSINWKASAKTGDLMVNTYDSTRTVCAMFYLDLEDSGILKQERLIEESISIAATMAQKYIGQGMEVGLAVNVGGKDEQLRFEPNRGSKQLEKIEQALACRRENEMHGDFAEVLQEPPKDTINIIISKNISKNQTVICDFLETAQAGIWIAPVIKGEEQTVPNVKGIRIYRKEVEAC